MADIRINSLPSTATSFNADDYIAIDGASAGTRKMLAANPPFTDVTLGASGPSVKSTLSARAPRQGLVFDGTAGATHSNITLGSGDFTVAVWARVPTTSAANRQLLGSSGGDTAFFLDTTGLAKIYISGQTTHTASSVVPDQKSVLLVYTRSGTSGTFYQNAVSNGTVTDSNNYSTAWSYFGARSGGGYTTGTLIPLIYNRALSAAEVVALYEAGAPAAADYPATAAGTTINSSAWVNNNYSTFSSANGATLSATYSGSGTQYAYAAPTFVSKYGNVIRFYYDLTLTSGQVPYVVLTQIGVKSCSATANLTAGSGNYVDLVVNDPSSATTIAINNTAASSWSIANARLTPLGLLLAPDAAQAGGGSVWYDTSGNAANITLPASGVSWNVPTSGKINNAFAITNTTASVDTSSGALVVSGGVGVGGQITAGGNIVSQGTAILIGNGTDNSATLYATGGPVKFFANASEAGRFATAGNLLIGTTTDAGQKLQVNGTAAISGAISIGNTVNTVSPTSPNRTITMVIGGTTYYIHAKTTND